MNHSSTSENHFELMKYLYQFKDDNKFYKIDKEVIKAKCTQEQYNLIYTLRDKALIATDREIHYNHKNNTYVDAFNSTDEIRARILPKGVMEVESLIK